MEQHESSQRGSRDIEVLSVEKNASADERPVEPPNAFVRLVVRKPCLTLVLSLVLACVISFVGLIVGEFKVSADNNGWQSRHTAVADKQAQDAARLNLFARNNGKEEEYRRRLQAYYLPNGESPLDIFSLVRAKKPRETLLKLAPLKELCEYEDRILKIQEDTGLCKRHFAGNEHHDCVKPVSFVTLLREYLFEVKYPDGAVKTWFSCERLFSEVSQSDLDALVDEYIAQAATDRNGPVDSSATFDIPEFYFEGLVGEDLVMDGKKVTTLLKSVFSMDHDLDVNQIYDLHKDGSFEAESDHFEVSYDTRSQELQDIFIDEVLQTDMIMACAATGIILFLIWFHTRSVFLAFIGIVQVGLSFPSAYFAYKLLFGLNFFPFLNFLAMFVVMGIGADDIFVLHDKFEQAAQQMPGGSISDIASLAIPQASYAMLLTSVTTAGAFFSTSVTPVAPIRMFAIFLGTMTVFDYIFVIIICAPAKVLQEYWVEAITRKGPHFGRLLKLSLLDYSKVSTRSSKGTHEKKDTLCQSVLVRAGRMTISFRYILVPGLLALFAYFTMVALDIPMPKTSEIQLLDDSHVFTKWSKWKNDVYYKDGGETSWVRVIWGLRPGDTGSANDPSSRPSLLLDSTFDLPNPEVQTWTLKFCDDLKQQSFVTGRADCMMDSFNSFLKSQHDPITNQNYKGMPIPAHVFKPLFLQWRQQTRHRTKTIGVASEIENTTLNGEDDIVFLVMNFEATVKWNDPYNKLKSQYYEWSDYIDKEMKAAPSGIKNGFFISDDFHWWDTNRQMKNSAYQSALISVGVATGVLLISNANVFLTLYSVVSIFCILVTVAATAVVMGWELGFLEAICFAILVGLSCDFIVHIAHAYQMSKSATRRQKSLDAIWEMGPPVLFAAVSTTLSGALLFSCNILFYIKFGVILMLTMAYSFIMIFVFLVPLLALAGPMGNWGDLTYCCRSKRK